MSGVLDPQIHSCISAVPVPVYIYVCVCVCERVLCPVTVRETLNKDVTLVYSLLVIFCLHIVQCIHINFFGALYSFCKENVAYHFFFLLV